ncbi:YqeB family protein [Streptomyces litchfieldiae]|uniref:DUF308 domain-containing protein n=1 Tax=Streptomyces litchfieldiae TaxID=3075543 RepID=A0ABU2MRF4_9ACTN|nr:hypothetical protein [Streptomyces sp. DSM 44938]MDT0344211.1 hypothetical protein [Streptomyces sp. DSM 44938]
MRTGRTMGTTTLGLTFGDRLLLIVGGPALGAVLGFCTPPVADWVEGRPWVPMQGPFELISSFEGRWVALVLGGVGLLLGLGLALLAVVSCLKVTVSDTRLVIEKDGRSRVIPRPEVAAVFLDGRKLVILDPASRELLRESHEGSAAQVARGFQRHFYPWAGRDPHAGLYRRWVPETPDLPPAVNALLKARESALRKKDDDDTTELREEIQRLGFVVRDDAAKQYWRPLIRP